MKLWDKLMNMVTGAGGVGDKTLGNYFATPLLSNAELLNMYRSDWVSRKIVDLPPFDMCREGRDWQADVDTEIGPLEQLEADLHVWQKLCTAMQWARLYGDAIIYMSIRGQSPTTPLKVESVTKDALQFIHVFAGGDTGEYVAGELDLDPLSETYGQPTYYEFSRTEAKTSVRVHPSRCVAFYGSRLPGSKPTHVSRQAESVLVHVLDAVQQAASSHRTVAALMEEAKIDVIHVPNLSDYLSTDEGTRRITARFQGANAIKSVYNMMLLEGDGEVGENWDQKQINFAGFTDLMEHYMGVASGAADIPVTRMLGRSPKGLNATGESDIRNYYDHIASLQQFELRPAIKNLDEVLIRSALGTKPDTIYYEFASLWQMGVTEMADAALKKAQATQIYVNTALIPSEVLEHSLKNQLIEDNTYPGIEKAFAEFDAGQLDPLDPEAAAVEEEQQALALEQQRKMVASPIIPAGPPKAKLPT